MYTQEIIETVTFVMGADIELFRNRFGLTFPKLLEKLNEADVHALRFAYMERNKILFSNSCIRNNTCADDIKKVVSQLKRVEDVIQQKLPILKECFQIAPHFQNICGVISMPEITAELIVEIQTKVIMHKIPFQFSIYMPTFTRKDIKDSIDCIFKNDYLFLKYAYLVGGKKLNMYRDYYCNSTVEPLRSIDAKIVACDNYEIFVDCDNVNSVYVYLLVEHLSKLRSVKRINLVYCEDSAFRWEVIQAKNISHHIASRILDFKNSSDIILGSKIAESFYTRGCRDMMIVSGDSDFYGIIKMTSDVTFTVLTSCNTSKKYINTLRELNISCYSIHEVFELADIVKRVNSQTGYYIDAVTSALHERSSY